VELLSRLRLAGDVMAHREFGRERGAWWKLGRDLLFMAAAAAVFSVLFILLSLALHGHVNW
jgi:hypothetical protein